MQRPFTHEGYSRDAEVLRRPSSYMVYLRYDVQQTETRRFIPLTSSDTARKESLLAAIRCAHKLAEKHNRSVIVYAILNLRQAVVLRVEPRKEAAKHALTALRLAQHVCPWPNCGKQLRAGEWACKRHWKKIRKELRDAYYASYKPGQEYRPHLTPTAQHADDMLRRWISRFAVHIR